MAINKDTPGMPIIASKQFDFQGLGEAREKIMAMQKITGSDEIDFNSTMAYYPELMPDVWQMPKSQQELQKNIRFFYNTDPYIHAITNMNARYPLSKFQIVSSDETVTKFYEKVAENRNFSLTDLVEDISLAYNKLGEVILMGVEKEVNKNGINFFEWSNFLAFEPETINIYKSALERQEYYTLVMTPDLKSDIKKMISSKRPINPIMQEAYNSGKSELNLDTPYMSKIINKTDVSALRGTSPLQCLVRTLQFQDKVNLLKNLAIDRYRYPLEIWKVGDYANGIFADPEKLEDLENSVREAKANPPYSLFVPQYVNLDVAGYSSQASMFNYKEDYEWVRDSILVGLGVSKDLVMGEAKGWASSTKQLTLQKYLMMQQQVREKYTKWIINNFFYPLAEQNEFYNEKGDLNLPQIVWEKDLSTDRNTPEEYMKLWEKGLISTKTFFTMYKNLSLEQEAELIKAEIGTIFDDGKRILNVAPKAIGEEEKKKEEEKSKSESEGATGEEGTSEEGVPAEEVSQVNVTPVDTPVAEEETVPTEDTTE